MGETITETSVPVVDGTEDNEAVETSVEEVTDATESSEDFIPVAAEEGYVPVDLRDEYEFYDMMYNSFEEFRLENNEQLEILCSQVSELNSCIVSTSDNTTAIKAQTEIEVILLFAVIAFCGMVCGLLIANCIRK